VTPRREPNNRAGPARLWTRAAAEVSTSSNGFILRKSHPCATGTSYEVITVIQKTNRKAASSRLLKRSVQNCVHRTRRRVTSVLRLLGVLRD
jgi:hypothetical protein